MQALTQKSTSYPFENPQGTFPERTICRNLQRGHKSYPFLKKIWQKKMVIKHWSSPIKNYMALTIMLNIWVIQGWFKPLALVPILYMLANQQPLEQAHRALQQHVNLSNVPTLAHSEDLDKEASSNSSIINHDSSYINPRLATDRRTKSLLLSLYIPYSSIGAS